MSPINSLIIQESYIAHVSTNIVPKALYQKETFSAPCKGFQGAAVHSAATARNNEAITLFYSESAIGFFYVHYAKYGKLFYMNDCLHYLSSDDVQLYNQQEEVDDYFDDGQVKRNNVNINQILVF